MTTTTTFAAKTLVIALSAMLFVALAPAALAQERAGDGLRNLVPDDVRARVEERIRFNGRDENDAGDGQPRDEVRLKARTDGGDDTRSNRVRLDARADGDNSRVNTRTRVRTAASATSTFSTDVRKDVMERIDVLRQAVADGEVTEEDRAAIKERVAAFVAERRAQTADVQEKRRVEVRAEIEERKEERAGRAQERREELTEDARDRVLAYIDRFVRRMDAAIKRMDGLAARLESRIEKLEENTDADFADALELLSIARAEIAVAADAVASAEIAAQEAVATSDDPHTALRVVRDLLAEGAASVRAAHTALRDALIATKASAQPSAEADEAETNDESEQ